MGAPGWVLPVTVLSADRVRSAFLLPADAPAARWALSSGLAVVTSVAVALGLFTVSWELLGNVAAGPYNVKLPSLLFSIAALCSIPVWRERLPQLRGFRSLQALLLIVAVILGLLVLATAFSGRPAVGAAQIAAVLTGAVLPAVAVVAIVRDIASLRWALRWFVAGAVVASLFGLYQLAAFYLGWPQLLSRTSAGVDGVTGRIQAFNYEPAYFAVFIVLALAAASSLALLSGAVLGWLPALGFAAVLVLVNVRALVFLLPVMAVLLAVRWRSNRRLLLRLAIAGAVVLLADVGGTAAVTAAVQPATAAPATGTTAPAARSTAHLPAAAETERVDDHSAGGVTTAETAKPGAAASTEPQRVANPPQAILDPNEESSNGPRLELYRAVLAVVAAHPVLGVGPGGLGDALRADGYTAPNQTKSVIANNIWLQALADGGVALLLAELALVVAVAVLLLDPAITPIQPLLAAWLSVVVVDGLLTSYFFDMKIWVVLAMLVAGTVALRRPQAVRLERRRAAR